MFSTRSLGALALSSVLVLAACDDDDPVGPVDTSIVGVAEAAGSFQTLLTALDAAGLTATLQGSGSFTVFAPTDAAFDALPAGTLDALLADTEALTAVLTYHVVDGALNSADVTSEAFIGTLNGQALPITAPGGSAQVAGAGLIDTDIAADNGIIHVVDQVLLPEDRNIVEVATDAGFSTLVTAVDAAGLTATLSGEGDFTVFAPTDAAFDALPDGTLDDLLANPSQLADILLYHTVDGRLFSDQVVSLTSATSLEGSTIPISVEGGVVSVDNATIVATDIQATNGVIHVIDAVILP